MMKLHTRIPVSEYQLAITSDPALTLKKPFASSERFYYVPDVSIQ